MGPNIFHNHEINLIKTNEIKKWTFFISFSRQGWLIFLWFLPKIHKKVRSNHENDEKNHQTKSKFYIVFSLFFKFYVQTTKKSGGKTFKKSKNLTRIEEKEWIWFQVFPENIRISSWECSPKKLGFLRFQNLEGIDTKVLELWDNHGFLVRVTPLNSEKWVYFFS